MKCTKCGYEFNTQSDKLIQQCPQCNEPNNDVSDNVIKTLVTQYGENILLDSRLLAMVTDTLQNNSPNILRRIRLAINEGIPKTIYSFKSVNEQDRTLKMTSLAKNLSDGYGMNIDTAYEVVNYFADALNLQVLIRPNHKQHSDITQRISKQENINEICLDDEFNHRYEGETKNGKPHGKGRAFFKSGALYFEGECFDGNLYKGTRYNEDGSVHFTGEFKHGEPFKGKCYVEGNLFFDGEINPDSQKFVRGKYYRNNGSCWEVESFVFDGEDLLGGRGKHIVDGDVTYIGDFVDWTPHGQGTAYCNGKKLFTGQLDHARPRGTVIVYDDAERVSQKGTFNGDFENYTGSHYEYFNTGDILETRGTFINGKANGKGKIYLNNVLKYEGELVDGEPLF